MSRVARRRLARYKRRKDSATTPRQFATWSIRFHNLCHRLHGPPDLWAMK